MRYRKPPSPSTPSFHWRAGSPPPRSDTELIPVIHKRAPLEAQPHAELLPGVLPPGGDVDADRGLLEEGRHLREEGERLVRAEGEPRGGGLVEPLRQRRPTGAIRARSARSFSSGRRRSAAPPPSVSLQISAASTRRLGSSSGWRRKVSFQHRAFGSVDQGTPAGHSSGG